MENNINLTDAQLALIIAEKCTRSVSQGAKYESEVIASADLFYKWLQEKKAK